MKSDVVIIPLLTQRLFTTAVLALSVLLLAGCTPPAPNASSSEAVSEAKPPPKPLTEEEKLQLEDFGYRYAAAMMGFNAEFAREAWDLEALIIEALGTNFDREFANGLKAGIETTHNVKPGGLLWGTFAQPWEMLRYREVDGEPRLLCRIVSNGVAYLELIPYFKDGKPKFKDVYMFSTGECLSDTFRHLMLPQLAEFKKTPLQKLIEGRPDPIVLHFEKFAKLSQSAQSGDFEAVLEHYLELPQELKDEKAVLLMYLGAAVQLMSSHEEYPMVEKHYHDAVMRFQELFGDDPAFLLMGIDYYFYEEDYEGATNAIDKLDAAVGGDPYLNIFRANVASETGQLDKALELALLVREQFSYLEDPHWTVITVQLMRKDWVGAGQALDVVAEKFDYEIDLNADPVYAEFQESAEGKAWWKRHKARLGQ